MADRFDKFTERARRVLTYAQEEAQRFKHNYIGTEHLLLGLIREDAGLAAKVLNNLGVKLANVRSAVEFIIGRGEKSPRGEIGLTPRAKKVIELSVKEARRLNHSYIGTEHLLLGLVREGEGVAFGILESLGVTLQRVRTETARVLSVGSEPPKQAELQETGRVVADALSAVRELGGSDLAADLARSLLVPLLRRIAGSLDDLAHVPSDPLTRRLIAEDVKILDDAVGVYRRHDLERAASALQNVSVKVRQVLNG